MRIGERTPDGAHLFMNIDASSRANTFTQAASDDAARSVARALERAGRMAEGEGLVSLSDQLDMREILGNGKSRDVVISERLCTMEQFDWASRSFYTSLEESDLEGGRLNSDVFSTVNKNRGDLVIQALEYGIGENATTTKLAVIQGEWDTLVFNDEEQTFGQFASRAVSLANRWDGTPNKKTGQEHIYRGENCS